MDGTRGYHTKWVSLKEKDKYHQIYFYRGFPGSSAGKESAYNAADPGSVPGSGRFPWRRDTLPTRVFLGFPAGSDGKGSACNAGELGLIPGLGRFPGGGNGNPLQYSCLENFTDRGAWRATVSGPQRDTTKGLTLSLSFACTQNSPSSLLLKEPNLQLPHTPTLSSFSNIKHVKEASPRRIH